MISTIFKTPKRKISRKMSGQSVRILRLTDTIRLALCTGVLSFECALAERKFYGLHRQCSLLLSTLHLLNTSSPSRCQAPAWWTSAQQMKGWTIDSYFTRHQTGKKTQPDDDFGSVILFQIQFLVFLFGDDVQRQHFNSLKSSKSFHNCPSTKLVWQWNARSATKNQIFQSFQKLSKHAVLWRNSLSTSKNNFAKFSNTLETSRKMSRNVKNYQ